MSSVPTLADLADEMSVVAPARAAPPSALPTLSDLAREEPSLRRVALVWPAEPRARVACLNYLELCVAARVPCEIVAPDGDCPATSHAVAARSAEVAFVFDMWDARPHGAHTALVVPPDADVQLFAVASRAALPPLGEFSALWIPPQLQVFAAVFANVYRARVRVMPQLWTSVVLPPALQTTVNPTSKLVDGGVDVAVLGAGLFSHTSSAVVPLLAADIAAESIRQILVLVAAGTPEAETDAIKTFAARLPRLKDKVKVVAVRGAEDIVPYFAKAAHYTTFVHHQIDRTEFPDLVWHLGHCGFPIVHNIKTQMQFGVRYVEHDIAQLAKLLVVDKASFNDAYVARNRTALKALAPEQHASRLLEELRTL